MEHLRCSITSKRGRQPWLPPLPQLLMPPDAIATVLPAVPPAAHHVDASRRRPPRPTKDVIEGKLGCTCTRQRAPAAYTMEHLPCSIINMNGRQPWLPPELESLPPVIATNAARRNQQTTPVATTLLPPSVEARRRRTTSLKRTTSQVTGRRNPPLPSRRCPDPSHSSRRRRRAHSRSVESASRR
ncbi:hypothetical protein ACLOJK_006975 [Asimina triloba]